MKHRTIILLVFATALVTGLTVSMSATAGHHPPPVPPPPPVVPPPPPVKPPPPTVCPDGLPPNAGKDGAAGNDACDHGPSVSPPPPTPPVEPVCPEGMAKLGMQGGVLVCQSTVTKVVVKTHRVVKWRTKYKTRTKIHVIFKRYCPKPPPIPAG